MSDKEKITQKYIYRFCLLESPTFEQCVALLTAEKTELETGIDLINVNYENTIRDI